MRGLATGADDYMVKPFSVPELLARIRTILRRVNPDAVADQLKAGDLSLDRTTRRVTARHARHHSVAHRVPPARTPDAESRPRLFAAPSCSMRSGATTSMSTSAPWTSMSAACASR